MGVMSLLKTKLAQVPNLFLYEEQKITFTGDILTCQTQV